MGIGDPLEGVTRHAVGARGILPPERPVRTGARCGQRQGGVIGRDADGEVHRPVGVVMASEQPQGLSSQHDRVGRYRFSALLREGEGTRAEVDGERVEAQGGAGPCGGGELFRRGRGVAVAGEGDAGEPTAGIVVPGESGGRVRSGLAAVGGWHPVRDHLAHERRDDAHAIGGADGEPCLDQGGDIGFGEDVPGKRRRYRQQSERLRSSASGELDPLGDELAQTARR